jgi:threonine/homoserine/homoserine lactone efflux protein
MGEAIGQSLPFAVGVAVSPMPIVAMVLMLITPRAKANGVAFVVGWIAGIAAGGAILLAIAGPAKSSSHGQPEDWVSWLKIGLGLLLLLVAVREWRARPPADGQAAMPKWIGMVESFSPVKAGGLAVLLGTINPKNLLLIVGGAAAVAGTGVSGGDQAVAWVIFTLIASVGVAAPLVIFLVMGERAAAILQRLKTWMTRNNTAIMAVLCLVIGVKLIGDAISSLTA